MCGHLGDKPSRRQSSRRQTNSATTNLATRVGQLGDNLFPAFHYIFLGLRDIGTFTSVQLWYNGIINFVIRYTATVPPHLPDGLFKPLKYCVGELRSNKVPTLPLTVLDRLYLRCIPAGELRTRKRRQLAPAEVVRVRIKDN